MNRFIVVAGSQAGHECCFTHTVLDTEDPDIDGTRCTRPAIDQYRAVCECYDQYTAEMIAEALNDMSPSSTIIHIVDGPDEGPDADPLVTLSDYQLEDLFYVNPLATLDLLWFGDS